MSLAELLGDKQNPGRGQNGLELHNRALVVAGLKEGGGNHKCPAQGAGPLRPLSQIAKPFGHDDVRLAGCGGWEKRLECFLTAFVLSKTRFCVFVFFVGFGRIFV